MWWTPGYYQDYSLTELATPWQVSNKEGAGTIPWICYERIFNEFYISIWNQLIFNQRLQLFVQSPQPCLWVLSEETKYVFPKYWYKKKWISEFRRTNRQEMECWSILCVNYFLGYYLMIQHQPIVKRVNRAHKWAHRPYQLLITAACKNTGGKMKGSFHRGADRCPFVPRHN